jgi:hypothetical protein
MRDYRKEFQEYWMQTDSKPKGRDRKYIQSKVRQQGKKKVRKELNFRDED